jgi:AraC family transcriptional activator of mtrCDE
VPRPHAGIASTTILGSEHKKAVDSVSRFRAGNEEPMTVMISGYFSTTYRASINLFQTLRRSTRRPATVSRSQSRR